MPLSGAKTYIRPMKILLSPAKSLREESWDPLVPLTMPFFIEESSLLMNNLKQLSVDDIASLMTISEKLASLNYSRFQDWDKTLPGAVPAIHLFNGDVYDGFDIQSISAEAARTANVAVRILSGLYGILKPYDKILPYRLEMGRPFPEKNGLYRFWKEKLTSVLEGEDVIYNLASGEYAKSVDLKSLAKAGARIIEPRFEDRNPKGEFKVISFFAKRARGLMARWLIENPGNHIAEFRTAGYSYAADLSTELRPVFRRENTI